MKTWVLMDQVRVIKEPSIRERLKENDFQEGRRKSLNKIESNVESNHEEVGQNRDPQSGTQRKMIRELDIPNLALSTLRNERRRSIETVDTTSMCMERER